MRKYADLEENDHTGLQFYLMSPSPAANLRSENRVPTLPIDRLNTRQGTVVQSERHSFDQEDNNPMYKKAMTLDQAQA